jgi:DNA-binding SARP family transcriptional activator
MQLYLFGRFSIFDQDHQSGFKGLLDSSRLQELLAYLLVHTDRPVTREEIAKVIWHEHLDSQAYGYACKAITKLEAIFSQTALHFIDSPDGLRYEQNTNLWVDVQELETIDHKIRFGCGESIESQIITKLLTITDLYRGPFLDGCYSPWCIELRSVLEQKFLSLIESAMEVCEARSDYDSGIEYGLRAIALEPSRESVHFKLMRFFYLAGDRSSALRQYQRCAETLANDLGISPGEKIVQLYRELRAGGQLPFTQPDPLSMSLHNTLRDLHHLDRAVNQLKTIRSFSDRGLSSLHQAA